MLKLILTDPGPLSNPTACPGIVYCSVFSCQVVLTCPYLTHRWLGAKPDRLLEGKLATIWNITACQKQPKPAHRQVTFTYYCVWTSMRLLKVKLFLYYFIHTEEVILKSI